MQRHSRTLTPASPVHYYSALYSQALSGVKQQKCLAHVLRSISEVVQIKTGRGRSFGKGLCRLLREAMELRGAYHRGEASDFGAQAERLKGEVSYHLRDRPMADADNYDSLVKTRFEEVPAIQHI